MSDSTHVAFLRGINVGGHNVKMDELRDHFETIGLTGVKTFIASGNVIFDSVGKSSAELERLIEDHLKKVLGYEVPTFVRSAPQLDDVAVLGPFADQPATDTDSVYVGFIRGPIDKSVSEAITALSNSQDRFHVEGSEIYWLIHGNFLDSSYSAPKIEKAIGSEMTIRNLTTVRRMVSKLHT